LAHHYSHSDNIGKAIDYLGRAGQQAMQRSAHADAIASLSSAIDLLPRLLDVGERTQSELFLQLNLAPALVPLKGWAASEVKSAYIRSQELCQKLGDPPELFYTLLGLWAVSFIGGQFETALMYAGQLLERAEHTNNEMLLLLAHFAIGNTAFNRGELRLSRDHLEKAISLYNSEAHGFLALRLGVDIKVNCLGYSSMVIWTLGYPDQALARAKEAVAFAQPPRDPHSLASVECFLGTVLQNHREARAAQITAERLRVLTADHGFSLWAGWASIQHGWALAEQGRHEVGIAEMEEGIAALRATGTDIGRPYYLASLAEACLHADRLEYALNTLSEAQSVADEHDGRQYEPEIHRLRGELLLRRDAANPSEAQECFQRSIEVAREQSAKSWELRATMSLARLHASQGRRDEARTMLAEIYNWFTEGFGTADLQDAKALLDELSA
jgi:predicted ATPase